MPEKKLLSFYLTPCFIHSGWVVDLFTFQVPLSFFTAFAQVDAPIFSNSDSIKRSQEVINNNIITTFAGSVCIRPNGVKCLRRVLIGPNVSALLVYFNQQNLTEVILRQPSYKPSPSLSNNPVSRRIRIICIVSPSPRVRDGVIKTLRVSLGPLLAITKRILYIVSAQRKNSDWKHRKSSLFVLLLSFCTCNFKSWALVCRIPLAVSLD